MIAITNGSINVNGYNYVSGSPKAVGMHTLTSDGTVTDFRNRDFETVPNPVNHALLYIVNKLLKI